MTRPKSATSTKTVPAPVAPTVPAAKPLRKAPAPASASATVASGQRGARGPRRVEGVPVAKVVPVADKAASIAESDRPRRRGSNKRSAQTIENILAVTETVVLESGADRISILDVCNGAGISRGTFYRYFASQDELLDAFSRHKRERFHLDIMGKVGAVADPDERFDALVKYLANYLEHGRSRRLLVVAPEYALVFFKRIFHDSAVRFQDLLGIVFDAWDTRLGIKVDRELVIEMLIRYMLSEHLVPSDVERNSIPRRIGRMVEAIALGATYARR